MPFILGIFVYLLTLFQGWDDVRHYTAIKLGISDDFDISLRINEKSDPPKNHKLSIGIYNKFSEPIIAQMNISLENCSNQMILNCTNLIGPKSFICNNNTFYKYEEFPEQKEIFLEFDVLIENCDENSKVCVEIQGQMFPKNKDKVCEFINKIEPK